MLVAYIHMFLVLVLLMFFPSASSGVFKMKRECMMMGHVLGRTCGQGNCMRVVIRGAGITSMFVGTDVSIHRFMVHPL